MGSRALFCPLSGSGGRKSLCRPGAHRRIGGGQHQQPPTAAKLEHVKSPPEFTSDLVRVGCIASGRVSWSTSGSPHTGKCAVSLWWLLLLGSRGARAGARTPSLPGVEGGRGGPGARASRGTAWRRRRVGPSRTSRLPSETASTEPGRPLAFHYRAYESSSPGKYVAIKINRPALSAEHNANYLWAVCAIFIIVQAPGASCLPASPARPGPRRAKLRTGCGDQGALGTVMGFRRRGRAPRCLPGREPHFSCWHACHTRWRPTTCKIRRSAKLGGGEGKNRSGEIVTKQTSSGPRGDAGGGSSAAEVNFLWLKSVLQPQKHMFAEAGFTVRGTESIGGAHQIRGRTMLRTGTGIRCPSSLKTCLQIADNRLTANCRNRPTI